MMRDMASLTVHHPDAIAGVTVVREHEIVALYPPDHEQHVEWAVDPSRNDSRARVRLIVFDGAGHEVARYEGDEWDVATAAGDFGCGGRLTPGCPNCHAVDPARLERLRAGAPD